MAGIKETLEVVALVDKTADLVMAAKADGSIDWRDLPKLGPEVAALKDALAGAQGIAAELADLDKDEVIKLYEASAAAVFKLAKAIVG